MGQAHTLLLTSPRPEPRGALRPPCPPRGHGLPPTMQWGLRDGGRSGCGGQGQGRGMKRPQNGQENQRGPPALSPVHRAPARSRVPSAWTGSQASGLRGCRPGRCSRVRSRGGGAQQWPWRRQDCWAPRPEAVTLTTGRGGGDGVWSTEDSEVQPCPGPRGVPLAEAAGGGGIPPPFGPRHQQREKVPGEGRSLEWGPQSVPNGPHSAAGRPSLAGQQTLYSEARST